MDDVLETNVAHRFVRADAVRPLLVGERPGRAERQHKDERLRSVLGDQLVLDDAHAHGEEERERPPGKAVQEVEHRIARVWMLW